MFFRSWLLLTVPLVMYAIPKLLIHQEDDYLRRAFREAYLACEREVNAVLPKVRRAYSYLVVDRFLFTGDTLVLRNGQARPFYGLFNIDTATQKQSIRKLARLQNVALLCTAHTGCTTDYERAMVHWRPQEQR
jgi:hypothetical protein